MNQKITKRANGRIFNNKFEYYCEIPFQFTKNCNGIQKKVFFFIFRGNLLHIGEFGDKRSYLLQDKIPIIYKFTSSNLRLFCFSFLPFLIL